MYIKRANSCKSCNESYPLISQRRVNSSTTEISFMQRSRVCWEVSVCQFAADDCLREPFISVTHAHYYTLLPLQHGSTPASHIAHSGRWYFRHRNNPYLGLSSMCLLKQFLLSKVHVFRVGKRQNLFPLLTERISNYRKSQQFSFLFFPFSSQPCLDPCL